MGMYGATKLDRTKLFQLILRYLKDGGGPADVVAALREAMLVEGRRLGFLSGGSWDQAVVWLDEVVSYLRDVPRV